MRPARLLLRAHQAHMSRKRAVGADAPIGGSSSDGAAAVPAVVDDPESAQKKAELRGKEKDRDGMDIFAGEHEPGGINHAQRRGAFDVRLQLDAVLIEADAAGEPRVPDNNAHPQRFIASESWAGVRNGMVFRSGSEGQGYYVDASPYDSGPTHTTSLPAAQPCPPTLQTVRQMVRDEQLTEDEAVHAQAVLELVEEGDLRERAQILQELLEVEGFRVDAPGVTSPLGVLMLQGPPYSTEQRTLMGLLLPSADLTRLHYDIMDERANLSVHDIMVREFGDDYMTILIPNCPQRAQPNDRPWWR